MKMPEPVAWMDRDGDVYKELPTPYWHPPHQALFSDAQLNEILNQEEVEHEANERNLCQLTDELAESRREVAQLQDQNTALDAKLASNEAVMRMALRVLHETGHHSPSEAIKALEEALK